MIDGGIVKDRERFEINENIRYCKDSKEKLIREINDLNDYFRKGLISKASYDNFFTERINGKTRLEWVDFCNRYIEEKESLINEYGKEDWIRVKESIRYCEDSKKELIEENGGL